MRWNPDDRMRELERRMSSGDRSAIPPYLAARLREGTLTRRQVEAAAALNYGPAEAVTGIREYDFCASMYASEDRLYPYIRRYYFIPEMLLAIAGWFVDRIDPNATDGVHYYTRFFLGGLEESYRTEGSVVWDGGIIQGLQYASEGPTNAMLGFVFNACEYFDALSLGEAYAQEQAHYGSMAIFHAVRFLIDLSNFDDVCHEIANRAIALLLPGVDL